jgi:ATP-dependent Clp protease ATP-binding subunit ClpA
MFERFTVSARDAVTGAQQQAARLQCVEIGAEHLLLALLQRDIPGSHVLRAIGADRDAVTRQIPMREVADTRTYQALGSDTDDARRRIAEAFGTEPFDPQPRRTGWFRSTYGGIPFTKSAKKALKSAVEEAALLGHGQIGAEHLVLGLLADPDGPARKALAATGVNPDQQVVRAAVLRETGRTG